MAIQFETTNRYYTYKGCNCQVLNTPYIGENFKSLMEEALAYTNHLGKEEIIFIEMSDLNFKPPFDFAYCDRSLDDCFAIIINSKSCYPFYLAHELVHLLPDFHDIDNYRILTIEGQPIENWPLFSQCVRTIEHLLSDIHIDSEVIKRGFSIEEHFSEQLSLGCPVFGDDIYFFDLYDNVRLASNYLQSYYQLKNAIQINSVDSSLSAELNNIYITMSSRCRAAFSIAWIIDALITQHAFLDEFSNEKFSAIVDSVMRFLRQIGVPSPDIS